MSHSRGQYFYVFDSHSRDERGLIVLNGNGNSVVLKFQTIREVENYLMVLHNIEGHRIQCIWFQLQFVKIDIPENIKNSLLLNYSNKKNQIVESEEIE